MVYRTLAEIVLLSHLAFILYAALGGLLVLRWRRAWLLHLPALLWGCLVEFLGLNCPLTDMENYFRVAAGEQGYQRGFIDHFVSSLIYPGLSPFLHILLGVSLAVANVVIYYYLFRKKAFQTLPV